MTPINNHDPRPTNYELRSTIYVLLLSLIITFTTPLSAQPSLHNIPKPATEGMERQVAELLDATWEGLTEAPDPEVALSSTERAARVGEAGEIFHAHGALEPAIGCYREAIERDPESARWPYLLGYTLNNQGRIEESLELLRRSEGLESNALTRFRIGEALAAAGETEQAREILTPLAGVDGLEAAVSAELGKIALLEGDVAATIQHLTDALERQPDAVSLHFPLAQAYRQLNDSAAAEEHAALAGQRAVRVRDPILQQVGERSVSSETYVAMGAQALKAGDLELARSAYGKAVELNPDNQRAWMNLGAAARQSGDFAQAEEHLRRALELDPEYGFAHFNLAELLHETARADEALHHYRRAVAANPRNVEFGIAYGDRLLAAGAMGEAAEQYRRVAEEAPDFARPRYLRGLAQVALDDLDAALESIEAAWRIEPENEEIARTFVRLASTAPAADTALRREALTVAETLFQEYRSTDEGELLAMALAANGDFERAAAVQEEVVAALAGAGVGDEVMAYLRRNLELYRGGTRAEVPWPE